MTDIELVNIDPEDIEDLLKKVEDSFDIQFAKNELAHILTFGEMCDHIRDKINLVHKEDCTTQQAFYKLRNALITALRLDRDNITPETSLTDILPRQIRKASIKQIEQDLGFKLSVLRPPHLVTNSLVLLLLASFIVLFFNWQFALVGIGLSIIGFWFSDMTGIELDLNTVGQLAEKMTRENYLGSRREPKSYNRKEVATILTDLLSSDLALNKGKLTREAQFS